MSPASAAPITSVDSFGENGPHTVVSDVRGQVQGNLFGVQEPTQKAATGIAG